MAAKEQAARDAQTQVENVHVSAKFRWRGMKPDGSAGAIEDNRIRLGLNVRFRNGEIEGRGGQQSLIDDFATDGECVTSLLDARSVSRRTLYGFSFGCPGAASPGLAFSIASLDPEQEPPLQYNIYKDLTLFNMTGGVFSGRLYLAADNEFSVLQPVDQTYGQDALNVGGTRQDLYVWTLPSPFTHVMAMLAFDGRLFMAANGGVGTSAVIAFDGRTINVIDLPTINPPSGFALYREKLVMGFDQVAGPNHIRVRSVGAPPGTWATVAPSAGTVGWGIQFSGDGAQAAGSGNGAGVSYRDKLYIASGNENVFVYDGTTLDPILIATTGIAAGSITVAVAVYRQKLFLLYQTAGGDVRLASFDGTTWVPIVVDFTAFFAGTFTLTDARNLVAYRQKLYAIARSVDLGDSAGQILYSAFGQEPDATNWVSDPTTGTTRSTDFAYFLVF